MGKRRFEPWITEMWVVGTLLLLGWLPAAWFGYGANWLAFFLCAYLFWHLIQLRNLVIWLSGNDRNIPENIPGIWHEIYHQLYLMQKRRRQQQRKLMQVISEFRDSTNALPDAAVSLGEYGDIVWFNVAAQELIGLDVRRDIGQRISNLVRNPKFVEFEALGASDQVLEIPSPLTPEMMLSFRLTQYRSGQRLLMVRDVTRLYKLEQVRQDFVANVSHELRTPITVLMGYLETMMESGDEKLGRYARPLKQMQQQALRMRSIVDDLLLLSRLDTERSKLRFERMNISRLVRTMADDARVLSGTHGHVIEMEIDDGLGVQGSAKELQSAFWNLVSNAVRYTPDGGTLTLRWRRDADGGARFEVRDTGVGIEPAHIPRLTERFYRVDAGRSREVGGTGLGLSIVKHVLERHGARLQIESVVGKGSTFSCVFPPSAVVQC